MTPESGRPELSTELHADSFLSFYWLKAELLTFCRAHKLSTQGSKTDLADRIAMFLSSGKRESANRRRAVRASPMPATFSRDTPIGKGWRCTEALRAFFCQEVGAAFRFDQLMRDFIAAGEGKTLQQAIDAWHQPRQKTPVAPQFEYNRHMRAFFAQHPDATRQQALDDWRRVRSRRREAKPSS